MSEIPQSGEMPIEMLFLLLVALLLVSAFFSGSETALMSINRYRLRHAAREGHRAARLAENLLKKPDRLIGLILLGNNLANIVASALVTVIAIRLGGQGAIAIGAGLLTLLAVERGDDRIQAQRMVERLLSYRVFADEQGRMNRSITDIAGHLLLVSQFTLAADTRKGTRPGFSGAADPARAEALYELMCRELAMRCEYFASGRFGANMQVALINDGPVTFLLEVK